MSVETAVAVWADRHLPVSAFADQARALAASGVVDGILLADQLGNFIPPQLWTAENTPMAAVLGDPDSHTDVFMMAGYLLAAAPGLRLAISTDSVRRPPAELVQAMLTLANITEGHASFHIGGGEASSASPSATSARRVCRAWRTSSASSTRSGRAGGPIDFAGKRWASRRPRSAMRSRIARGSTVSAAARSCSITRRRTRTGSRSRARRSGRRPSGSPPRARRSCARSSAKAATPASSASPSGSPSCSPTTDAAARACARESDRALARRGLRPDRATTAGERTGSTRRCPRTGATTSTCSERHVGSHSSTTSSPR